MISVFKRPATVTDDFIIISGDDDLLSITVHHQVGVMRHDNDLPVLFYFSEEVPDCA
jgi:pyruvate/2-oxoacid:ferredoxin oxidoreductase beta subunit